MDLVFDAKAELGEGPVWEPKIRSLYWLDFFVGHVHRYNIEKKIFSN